MLTSGWIFVPVLIALVLYGIAVQRRTNGASAAVRTSAAATPGQRELAEWAVMWARRRFEAGMLMNGSEWLAFEGFDSASEPRVQYVDATTREAVSAAATEFADHKRLILLTGGGRIDGQRALVVDAYGEGGATVAVRMSWKMGVNFHGHLIGAPEIMGKALRHGGR